MTLLPLDVPVTPDGDTARSWVLDELAKQEYAAAQPSLFDRLASGFLDWFTSLFDASRSGAPPVLLTVALVLLAVVVVVALVLFGLPRVNRRSSAGTLFGEDDRRTADEMRRAARDAYGRGDWATAVLERFRAIARALDERTVVQVFPGTTAGAFARRAADAFDDQRTALREAARLFDGVRYADRVAGREDADAVASLDDRLAAARPRLENPVSA